MVHKEKLGLYVRLSAEDGDLKGTDKQESNSVSNQRKLLLDYVRHHEELQRYEIMEFCDDGYTGTNFNRPAFQEMMNLVKSGIITCIMVKDLSRFGREYLEVGRYLELILPLFQTRFISVNDAFDSERYKGTTGGMELALHNLVNSMYSRDLSLKIRSAVKVRNRRGYYWGGGAFYGYLTDPENKHHLIVNEEVRWVIELIFELCLGGLSTKKIAQELNRRNILCPAAYKKENGMVYNGRTLEERCIWLGGTVRNILNDERYTGKMITGQRESTGIRSGKVQMLAKEKWIVTENSHEAIISQDIFDRAGMALQARIKTRNPDTAKNRGDMLFVCGHCGRKMQKSNGKETFLYCPRQQDDVKSACANIQEDYAKLQQTVVELVSAWAVLLQNKSRTVKKNTGERMDRLSCDIAEAQKCIRSIQNGKGAQYEDYRMGRYSREEYMQLREQDQVRLEELENKLESYRKELEAQQEKRKKIELAEKDALILKPLVAYEPAILKQVIKNVSVYENGKIEVHMKNKDVFA